MIDRDLLKRIPKFKTTYRQYIDAMVAVGMQWNFFSSFITLATKNSCAPLQGYTIDYTK